MEFSNKVKARFTKDHKLPIQVIREPVFSYAIDRLDDHFDTRSKLAMLVETISSLGSEEAFFQESHNIITGIIGAVKKGDAYKSLAKDQMLNYNITRKLKNKNMYSLDNDGKSFVSIDLSQANFNSYRYLNSDIVLGADSFHDLIGRYTEYEYFKSSKHFRQVIFGGINPSRCIKLQEWIINLIFEELKKDINIDKSRFVTASSDELVITVADNNINDLIAKVRQCVDTNENLKDFKDWINVEGFVLNSIGGKEYFTKTNVETNAVEFKAIPSYLFLQVYSTYLGEPVTKNDLTFVYENMLAQFEKSVFE